MNVEFGVLVAKYKDDQDWSGRLFMRIAETFNILSYDDLVNVTVCFFTLGKLELANSPKLILSLENNNGVKSTDQASLEIRLQPLTQFSKLQILHSHVGELRCLRLGMSGPGCKTVRLSYS